MSAPAVIELEGVHKHYDFGRGRVHALRGVDLRIEAGEWVAVMGPSGAGKTTLLEILGCLSRPSGGRYRLGGRSVDDLAPDALARVRGERIGFVFQSFNLLPRLSAADNVALPLVYRRRPRAERVRRAHEALARVGLEARGEHRPAELSGGERQRVAIARALVNAPSLLLADEPTGNLDSGTSEEILALLHGLHDEGNAIVLVTHDPAIGGRAPRLVTIRDGRIESDRRTGAG
ncbi:MAG: ABC transporter ATP-binding protein [Deltaproteobacteria bacterium]|nr:ABC transporter ATP-binding protein [Deltaproteobacteria bacterium]